MIKDQQTPIQTEEFTNPYLSSKTTQQISAEFDSNDYNLIKSIRPKQGTVTITMSLLWKQLCYELRQRNITNWETDCGTFLQFMQGFRIVPGDEYEQLVCEAIRAGGTGGLQHLPVGGIDGKTGGSNVGSGVTGVCESEQGHAPKLSDVSKRSGKGRKGQKGEERGGE